MFLTWLKYKTSNLKPEVFIPTDKANGKAKQAVRRNKLLLCSKKHHRDISFK